MEIGILWLPFEHLNQVKTLNGVVLILPWNRNWVHEEMKKKKREKK